MISSSQLRPGSRTESSRVRDRAVYGGGALGGSGSGHGEDAPDGYRHRSRRSEDAYDYSSGGSTPRGAAEAAAPDRGRGASAAGVVHQGDAAPRHRRSGSDPAAAAARKAAADRFRAEREAELARHADVASGGLGSLPMASVPQRPRPPPPSYEAATRAAAEPVTAAPRADADAPRRPPAPARKAQPAAPVRSVGRCCEQRLHLEIIWGISGAACKCCCIQVSRPRHAKIPPPSMDTHGQAHLHARATRSSIIPWLVDAEGQHCVLANVLANHVCRRRTSWALVGRRHPLQ